MISNKNSQVLPASRKAGVCLHVSALPGRFGIGEIGSDAFAFVDAMQRMDLSVWQVLPLGPTAYGDSPYQALSTFAGNELLVSTDQFLRMGLLSEAETAPLTQLPRTTVDYGQLIPTKTALLAKAARRFSGVANSRQKSRFDDFLDTHDDQWLHEYALFRVLKDQHGQRPWPEWQPQFVHHDDKALREIEIQFADRIEELKTIQFLFFDQWQKLRSYANESGIQLFGDMPIYVALDSADAWSNPHLLNIDRDGQPEAVAGVPPDYFSADGQLWGNPLYDWDAHAESGFEWWSKRLQSTAELVDLIRVDHFRGFEGYFAVPAGADTARDGEWRTGPGDSFFHAMKDRLGSLPIIAEDLGVITPEVEAMRDRHGIPGMVVLQFEVTDPEFSVASIRDNCVCYTGTHDNDTTVGWFEGSPGGDSRSDEEIANTRARALHATNGAEATIAHDMVRLAMSSAARLTIAPMQDFLGLGSDARFNIPGTTGGNWQWRVSAAQLDDVLCNQVAAMVAETGRGRPRMEDAAAG